VGVKLVRGIGLVGEKKNTQIRLFLPLAWLDVFRVTLGDIDWEFSELYE